MTVDSFGQFLNEAGRITLLTADEEIYLGKSVQAMLALLRDKPNGPYGKLQMATLRRGKRAKERMVKANLRLVVMISRKYSNKNPNSGVTIEDLVQEGSIGLMRAVEKYDPTRGYKFSTYAFWWIKQGITRYLHQKSRMIRPPHHIAEKIFQINRVTHDLSNALGRRPSMDELAAGLDLTREELDLMRARASGVRSLDELIVEDGSSLLEVVCSGESSEQQLSDLNETLHLEHLQDCIEQLDEKERQMLILRYGLNGQPQHTYIEIAKQYDLSRERVRQYVERSQRKLRILMAGNQLATERAQKPLYKVWTAASAA
jgi:RNA polymerase primary sigma factor